VGAVREPPLQIPLPRTEKPLRKTVQLCALSRASATSCSKLLRNKDFFLMHGRSWCRLAGAVMPAAFAIRLYAQTPVPGAPDLFVTKVQAAPTRNSTAPT